MTTENKQPLNEQELSQTVGAGRGIHHHHTTRADIAAMHQIDGPGVINPSVEPVVTAKKINTEPVVCYGSPEVTAVSDKTLNI